MRVLAIDSATSACSAAVVSATETHARRYREMVRGHAEALMPMVADVLAECGLTVKQLDLLAVTVGPGAFTGVRIGLAAAQAMALAAKLPLSGVTTLEAVAAAQQRPEWPLLVALDTKRADIYVQLFEAPDRPVTVPAALAADRLIASLPLVPAMVAGDAAGRARKALAAAGVVVPESDGPVFPDAALVGRIAAGRAARDDIRVARPLYLRPPDVGPPRRPAT